MTPSFFRRSSAAESPSNRGSLQRTKAGKQANRQQRKVFFEQLEDRRVMATLSASLDGFGQLLISDALSQNNNLTISASGTNLVITDTAEAFSGTGGIAGAVLSNGDTTLTIPAASITGGQVIVNGGNGNDTLTVNLTAGDAIPTNGITFHGGGPTTNPGDKLNIIGGTPGSVIYNYTNATDGSVAMSAYGTVSYTGLEPVLVDSDVSPTDVTFNLPAGAGVAILEDDAGAVAGQLQLRALSGSAFETTSFTAPTGNLTINATDGDTLQIAASVSADLTSGGLVFAGSGVGTNTMQLNAANILPNALDVTVNAATFDLASFSETIDALNGNGVVQTTGGTPTLTVGGGNGLGDFGGVLQNGTGTLAFTKTGTGTQTLSGSVSNTHTGTTTLDNGILFFSKTGGAAAIAGLLNLGSNNTNQPTLRMGQPNQFAATAVVNTVNVQNNWVRFDLLGNNQTLTNINDTVGGLVLQNSGIGLPIATNATLTINNTANLTLRSHIRNADGSGGTGTLGITKTGSGTLTLRALPAGGPRVTHTGPTLVTGGELILMDLGDGTPANSYKSPTQLDAGTVLRSQGASTVQTAAGTSLTLNGGTYYHEQSQWFVWSGALNVNVNSAIHVSNTGASNQVFFDGGINGPNRILTINNTGTATTGVHFRNGALGNYSGSLVVNNGQIAIGNAAANWFANTDLTLNSSVLQLSNAAFSMTASGASLRSLNGNGTVTAASGAATTVNLTVGTNNGNGTFTGSLINGTNGTLNLIKTGTGTQVLNTNTNTYSGTTTINGGVLEITQSTGLGTAVGGTILDGGTLRSTGNITLAEPFALNGDGTIHSATAGTSLILNGIITTNNKSLQTTGAGDVVINGNLIGAPTNYNASLLANSPVAYWRLDETNTASPAIDLIGGRNGTYTNFDNHDLNALGALNLDPNPSAQFDGVNNIIAVPSDAGLNALIAGDYTIQFWMYKDSEAGDWQRLVGKGNGPLRQTGVWEEAGAGKRLLFQIYNNAGGVPINMMSNRTIEIGQWYHVAAVKQGSTASIYINGALDATVTAAPFTAQTSADPLTFGKLPTEHTFFPGRLDEIALFGSALSGPAINQLAQAGASTGNLVKQGTGTLTLAGTNTHVGGTSVQAGLLVATNSSALGTSAVGTTVFQGATLGLSGGITIADEDITLQGTGVGSQPGALVNLSGNNTIGASSSLLGLGGVGSSLGIGSVNDGGTAFVDTLTIDAPINLQTANLVFNGTGNVNVSSAITSSIVTPTLATLDNFATGTYSLSTGGDSVSARIQNDGTDSWLLIGRGRQGWQFDTDGQRRPQDVNTNLGNVQAFAPAAFSDALVNELLQQAGINNTNVEIRLRRAADISGTAYQESRWRNFSNSSFTFDFDLNGLPTIQDGDGYPVLYQILSGPGAPFTDADSNTNDSTITPNADSGNDFSRVFTWAWVSHNNQQGFSYGGTVQGVDNNSPTSFLWENGVEIHAIPYTEVYIRSLTTNVVAPTANTVSKQGIGTVNLSGTSTYTGATTVTAGTLLVNGSISSSAVTVQSGATLGGTGTTGPLTINAGGTHSPGNSPGITTVVGNYIENGLLVAEIGTPAGSVAGTDYDQVQVTAGGSVTIGGTATLSVPYLGGAGTFAPAFAQVYTIIDNDGAVAGDTTGTFTGFGEGALVTVDGRPLRIYYHGGDGNDVVLVSANNPSGNTLYVDDSFTAPGPVDGDREAAGVQTAYVGVNAFASVADLLAAYPAFAGTVILNGGTYASVALAGGGAITLQLVRDLTSVTPDVVMQNLTGDASDAIVTRFYNVAGGNLTVEQGTFAGLISGAGSLTKSTAGTFTLTSAVANTYAGGTTVNGGILSLGTGGVGPNTSHPGALSTGAVTVNSGAQVRLWIQNSNSFTVSNAFNLNGGTIHDEDGIYNLTGVITLGTGGGTLSAKWNNKTLTASGQITGTTGLTIANANGAGDGGSTVILSNSANNYAGGTTINNLLRLGAANVIPNGVGTGNVTIAGTLDLRGFAETINGLSATVTTASVTSGVAGAVTLTVGDNNATASFAGIIANGSGTVSLTKIGTGNQTLTNKNTYTGGTLVSTGTLTLAATANNGFSTVGTGDLTISTGAIVVCNTVDNQLGHTTAANIPNVIINGGTLTASSPSSMWFKGITMTAGTINGTGGLNPQTAVNSSLNTLASATTATVSAPIINSHTNFIITVANGAAANDLTLSSVVSGGAATGITKSGPGLLHQAGTWHNFVGTLTVNGGTFNTGGTNLFTPNHGTGKQNTFVMIVDGATWTNSSGVVNRIGNVTLRNAATWTMSGASFDWGNYFVGPLSDGSQPTVTVDGVGASTINGNGNLRLGVTPTFNVADVTSSAATDLTVDVELENQTNAQGFAAANIIKSGAGTMLFSAPNTYTGTTAVNAGVLSLQGGAAIADAAGAVSVANLATLQLLANETISSYMGADDIANENDSLLAIAGFTLTTTGSATIANVTSANGSIVAGASIIDGDADNNISGTGVFLSAVGSVGTLANPIEASVANLEGVGGTGFFVASSANLIIGGVTAATGIVATGDVVVSSTGSLTVTENITATGAGTDVTLTTIDAAGAGQDLFINGSVTVSSPGGFIVLNAGDNATINGTLVSGNTVTVNLDSAADAGTGSSLSFTGDIDAPLAVFNGFSDSVGDSFNTIRPDQDAGDVLTPIQVFGMAPNSNPNGDSLVLDITGLGIPTLTLGPGPRNGSFSFGALAAPLTYNNIENVSTSPALPYHLVLDMRFSGFENGVADTILAQLNAAGTELILDVNAANVFTGPDNVIQSLTIIGSNDNDALTIQETAGGLPKFLGGAPLVNNTGIGGGTSAGSHLNSSADLTLETLRGVDTPWNSDDVTIHFDGGAAGTDSLTVNYTTLNNTGYFSDTSDAGNSGNVLSAPGAFPAIGAPTLVVSFANLEPLTLSGAGGSLLADATGTAATSNLTVTDLGATSQITGDGGFAATTFSGYSSVAVIGGGGAELIDVVSIDGAVLTSLTLFGGNTSDLLGLAGGDVAGDTLRVRSLPATVTATLQGNAGSDLFQLFDATNTVDSIAGPVVIDGNDGNVGGNTDTLTIIDGGDVSGDTNVVIAAVSAGSSADYSVDGINPTVGTDVVLRNIDVLNYTSTAADDQIDGRFESTVPAHDLNTVNLSGWTGADQFLLYTSDQIGGTGANNTPTGTPSGVANINLFGDALGNPNAGDGNDIFGLTPTGVTGTGAMNVGLVVSDATRMIRPSASTSIAINGGTPTGLAAPLGDVIGDVLNVDISALPNSAAVIVSTFSPGTVVAAGIQPLTWVEIEDINLVDQGKLTNVQMGDLFARTTPNPDLVQITRNPTALNPNQVRLRITATIGNYSASNKTIIYAGGMNDTLTQSNLTIPAEFYGEGGDDYISGATNNDWLVGGDGNDRINGGHGDNVIWGDNAPTLPTDPQPQDLVAGGDDQLSGLGGNDVFYGGGGNDTVSAGGGNDYAYGGAGNDTLDGHEGDDRLYGGAGNDILSGHSGSDLLSGAANDDKLYGDAGNDVLFGGTGADLLDAGAGNDLLVSGSVAGETSSWTSVASTSTYNAATYTLASDNDAALLTLLAQWATFGNRGTLGTSPAITHDGANDDLWGSTGDDDFCWENADVLENPPGAAPPDFNAFGLGMDERFGPT